MLILCAREGYDLFSDSYSAALENEALRSLYQTIMEYLGLVPWLRKKLAKSVGRRISTTYESVGDFWVDVLVGNIKPADVVKFKGAFVSEWIPRIPGQVWRRRIENCTTERDVEGALETLSKHGGAQGSETDLGASDWGAVRLATTSDDARFGVLGLTTADYWYCDLGVPVVVSKAVYDQFIRKAINNSAPEVELEGTVCFDSNPLFSIDGLRSIGSDVPERILSILGEAVEVPKISIYVGSPIDTVFRHNSSHPDAYVWAFVRTLRNEQYTSVLPKTKNGVPRLESAQVEPYICYGLFTNRVQPCEEEQVRYSVEAFKKGWFPIGEDANEIAKKHVERLYRGVVGSKVLTEFDQRIRRFRNSIPLGSHSMMNSAEKEEVQQAINELRVDRWLKVRYE